jgi:ribosome-associated protein
MESRQLALRCREHADAKKAEDPIILDVRKVASVTDYFVLATGTSEPHLRAIAREIIEGLRVHCNLRPRAVDGTLQAGWIVVDYNDVIVHLMRKEQRERYDLEGLWGDAPRLRAPARSRKRMDRRIGPAA